MDNETVDHDDRNIANDNLDNLIVRDRIEHIKLDAIRLGFSEVECIWCKTKFMYKDKGNSEKAKAGPFCSRKCSGQYGASVQNGGNKMNREEPIKNYFIWNK